MATLEQKIRAAAAGYAPLAALIGTGSPVVLRWYDRQLVQGSAYPAVVAMTITNPPGYVFTGRLIPSWALCQYTVWGGTGDAGVQSAEAVSAALEDFFDQLDLVGNGRAIQQNNLIIANREAAFVQATTLIYQRVLEVRLLG